MSGNWFRVNRTIAGSLSSGTGTWYLDLSLSSCWSGERTSASNFYWTIEKCDQGTLASAEVHRKLGFCQWGKDGLQEDEISHGWTKQKSIGPASSLATTPFLIVIDLPWTPPLVKLLKISEVPAYELYPNIPLQMAIRFSSWKRWVT